MKKHRKILKRIVASMQLAVLSLGFAFTALPITEVIEGQSLVVKADPSSDSSSGDSNKSSKKSGDNSDGSGSNSSNSSDSKDDTPAPIKNMEEKLGKKNNILNPQFPDGVKQAAFSKSGALGYNKQAQIAITYAILSGSYPSNYKDIYKTGETTANELNGQLKGLNIPKMGTDTFVKQLSDAAGDEGGGNAGGQTNNPNGPTKAEEIETSSFPTDMTVQQMNQWKNASANKALYEMMQPIAKKLAENAISAVSVSDKVDWKFKKTLNSTNGNGLEDTKASFLNGEIAGMKQSAKNLLSNPLHPLDAMSKESEKSVKAAENKVDKRNVWAYSTQEGKDWIGSNSAVSAKENDIESAMILDALNSKTPTMHSKSDLEKYLSNLSPATVNKDVNLDAKNWVKILPKTADINSTGGVGWSGVIMPCFSMGVHTEDNLPTVSDARKAITCITPDNIKDLGGFGTAFKSHYNKEINAKVGKVTITDTQWQAFQKAQKNKENQKDVAANATNGDAVLSWSPAVPYSKATQGGTNKGDLKSYTTNGGLLMKDSNHYATANGQMIGSKSPLVKDAPWQIALGGSSGSIITDGDSIDQLYGVNGVKGITDKISNSIAKAPGISKSDIFGYDAYGDIIDGQNMKVIVPYWQNTTIKGIRDLKNPFMMTNMPIKNNNWPNSQIGCATVSDKAIASLDSNKSDQQTIEKVRDAIKNNSGSQRKAILAANKAVGSSSNSALSKKAAACVAVLITAGTSSQIGAYNKDYLSKVQQSQQCYIGESIDATKKNNDNNKGQGLYTAADVIQRFGLMTDYGLAGILRKTLVGFLVSTYNEDFVRNQTQNVFATEVYGTDDSLAELGTAPYFLFMIVLDIILGIITTIQYYRGTVKAGAFVTRFLKALIMVIIFGLIGYGVIPQFEEWLLNEPIALTTNKIIKRESVLDMWCKLREQKSVNNVFYEDLMQDNFGPINRSMNYLIPFYTSTRQDGTIDAGVSDPMEYEKIAKNHGSNSTNNNPMEDNSTLENSAIYREGDGKVPPLTPYKYKKVYVSLLDLTNWASHMARQKLSAEGKPGFQKGDPDYEAPANGYEPGKEPLFVWLAQDYQPVETSNDSESNSQDTKNQPSNGLNGNGNTNGTNADTNNGNNNTNNNNGDNNNNANASAIGDYIHKGKNQLLSILNGTFDKVTNTVAYADASNSTRDKIVSLAKTQIHKAAYFESNPQIWDKQLDCSGLVELSYHKAGINDCPRTSGQQYAWAIKGGAKPESAKDAKPGDLGFLGPQGSEHVVIYAGDGKVVQESDPQEGCNEKPVYGGLQFLDMSKQIGAASGGDSSSDSSNNNSNNSSSGNGSGQEGLGNYGKVRNPADTSPKSEMKTGESQGQTGAAGNEDDAIDNSAAYKNFDKYAEFAVNTKHYASKSALKYGIDTDSSGGQLTASQAFLDIWENCFQNSGNGDPGDAQSFTALMNFADAMNKSQSMGDQTTDTKVGDGKNGDLSRGEVGSVGRNALINEISMTQDQRKELNGGQGGFSKAAQQMINSFKIPANSKGDYFNLSSKGSIIDIMDPDQKVDGRARDALIFAINKKVLNDYVTIYSTVRRDIQPTDANSSDDNKNNQADNQGVDPFTMAEDQVIAADMFFTINKKLDYRMFPTGYDPHSITLNSWDRMLFIPIGAMKQLNDTSTYDIHDKTDAAKIALQDNVVEYIALNSSILDLIAFIVMNFMLIGFGMIMKFFFLWFFPLFLVGAMFRYFIFSKGSGKGIMTGSLFAVGLFGVMKFGLGFIFNTLSNGLNNSYTAAQGYTQMHVFGFSLAVAAYLGLCLYIVIKYIMFILGHFWTLGATANGNVIRGFGSYLAASHLNPFKRSRERAKEKWRLRSMGRKSDRYTEDGVRSRANKRANDIKKRSAIGGGRRHRIIRAMTDSAIISSLSKGKNFFVNHYKDKDKLKYRLHNIINSKTGAYKETESGGLDINKINGNGNSAGTHIDDVHDIKAVKYDMHNLNDDGLNEIADIIASDEALKDRFYVDFKNKQLVARDVNDKMLSTPEGRKELFAPLLNRLDTISKKAAAQEGSNKLHHANRNMPLIIHNTKNGHNEYQLRVSDRDGISPEALNKLTRSMAFNSGFKVIDKPVKGRDGKYTNGMLRFVPIDGDFDSERNQKKLNKLASRLDRYVNFDQFNSTANKYLSVGTSPELIKMLRQHGFNNVINGRLYAPSNSPEKEQKRLVEAQDLVRKFNANHLDTINRLGNAASSYVVGGSGKGMIESSRDFNPDMITRRFKAINNKQTINALNGLSNMSRQAGITMEARKIQSDINRTLTKNYGGAYKLAQMYANVAADLNNNLSNRANKIIKAMDDTVKAAGTSNINQMSQVDRTTLNNQLFDLENELKKDSKLNLFQSELISRINDSEINDILERRRNLIFKSGLNMRDANKAFKNLTPGEIGEYAATLSKSQGGIKIDKNGILSMQMNAKTRNEKREIERISSMIKSISQG